MKLTPEELKEKGYVLLDQLDHRELVPFVRTYLNKKTKSSIFFYLCNLLLAGCTGYLLVAGAPGSTERFGTRFSHFSYGLAFSLLLVPVHEYIHLLAYKLNGAARTSLDAHLKKFYFMALADQFVASKREFQCIALAPFVVITLLLTALLCMIQPDWMITVMATLLLHTAMCSGDFGLLSYMECQQDKQPVTYDDVAAKISYFYGKTGST